ncbi:hypothetical protein D3C71_2100250 [compost metagenome]
MIGLIVGLLNDRLEHAAVQADGVCWAGAFQFECEVVEQLHSMVALLAEQPGGIEVFLPQGNRQA